MKNELSLLVPTLPQQLVPVLCFYCVKIEMWFWTNEWKYFVIIIFHLLATDFSDDEGEESEKDNEEPEEWGKFLHLKERVRTKQAF